MKHTYISINVLTGSLEEIRAYFAKGLSEGVYREIPTSPIASQLEKRLLVIPVFVMVRKIDPNFDGIGLPEITWEVQEFRVHIQPNPMMLGDYSETNIQRFQEVIESNMKKI